MIDRSFLTTCRNVAGYMNRQYLSSEQRKLFNEFCEQIVDAEKELDKQEEGVQALNEMIDAGHLLAQDVNVSVESYNNEIRKIQNQREEE